MISRILAAISIAALLTAIVLLRRKVRLYQLELSYLGRSISRLDRQLMIIIKNHDDKLNNK